MSAPVLYEQTDFADADESLPDWHHRIYPAPTRRARAAIWLPGVGAGVTIVALLDALRLLVLA